MEAVLQEPVVEVRVSSAVFISLKAFLFTSTKTDHRRLRVQAGL